MLLAVVPLIFPLGGATVICDGVGVRPGLRRPAFGTHAPGVFAYRVANGEWMELGRLPEASMDHRDLIEIGRDLIVVGGMGAGRQVSQGVLHLPLVLPDKKAPATGAGAKYDRGT